jgi:hypothetical protein
VPKQDQKVTWIAFLLYHAGSEYFYVSTLGKVDGLPGTRTLVKKQEGDLLSWMGHVHSLEIERISALTEETRSHSAIHWKRIWTAMMVLRRMLEHEWEYLVELSERLGMPL